MPKEKGGEVTVISFSEPCFSIELETPAEECTISSIRMIYKGSQDEYQVSLQNETQESTEDLIKQFQANGAMKSGLMLVAGKLNMKDSTISLDMAICKY